jgi:hypothetical protein
MISRGMVPESKGVVHWSISSVVRNTKLAEALLTGPYKKPALVPASPWLDRKVPGAPVVTVETQQDQIKINWSPADERDAFRYVVYYRYGDNWNYQIVNRKDRTFNIKRASTDASTQTALNAIAVTTVDRVGNESERKEVSVAQ